jgi:hypothetical protein
MIPDFVDIGSLWKVLPPGVYKATIKEIEARFAISDYRKHLFLGLQEGVRALRNAGCRIIFLDGSFITEKHIPKDYDVCWDPRGVDITKLDPVFLDFSNMRKKQKERFYGEFFPTSAIANGVNIFSDYFQRDKYTGKLKGIIRIILQKN